MSSRIHYLSSLVLLGSAFPAQLFRIGLAMAGPGRPGRPRASALRRALGQLWLPGAFLLVAALVWYVAPSAGVLGLPAGWYWYAIAVAAGLVAPALEVATGALVAGLRRQRVGVIRLHERWAGGSLPAVAGAVLVALAEEVIFRGVGLHLLVRELGWPAVAAVALTAVVYGLNHLYFGGLTVLQKAVTGVLYGWLFLASGHSVLVPVIAHVLQNLLVLLVLPRLGGRK
jgi:membrane protease YdiL (CAAX protease family)